MAPHDHIIWFTCPNQLDRLEKFALPMLKRLASELDHQQEFKGFSVIVRTAQQDSQRHVYGILFFIYQKITLMASRIDPRLTAKLDLRVYLEHFCDIELITSDSHNPIDFILYEDASPSPAFHQQRFQFHRISRSENFFFIPESPLLCSIPDEEHFLAVALGGTFDHLHSGHKLMLSLAALLSFDRILCGITASEMLSSKTNPMKLEPLEQRMFTVQRFFREFKRGCTGRLEIVTLKDPFGPTVELTDLDSLIVSPETLSGGLKINEIRQDSGLSTLQVIQVDLIIADEQNPDVKLSSTFIRGLIE